MKTLCKIITYFASFCLLYLLTFSTIAFCDSTSILIGPDGTVYETYSAMGVQESAKMEYSRWTVNDKQVYRKLNTEQTDFTINRNEAGEYDSKYVKKETSDKNILGIKQKKVEIEGERQWGKGGYRADTYYKDENGVLRNGLGEKASEKEKKAYKKATDPSIKDKIKDNTSIKIDEKTYWDEGDALIKEEEEFEDLKLWGQDFDAKASSEVLGYSTSAKRQIECKGGDCGVEYSINAEAVLARVEGEVETKFLEDHPFLNPIESKTTGTLEAVAEVEAKGGAKIGTDGVNVEGGVEAFAGGRAKIEEELKTDLFGLGVKLNLDAQGSYGIGGEAKGNFNISWTKIQIGGKLAGTLGLGVGAGANLEIDISKWTTPIRDLISSSIGNEKDKKENDKDKDKDNNDQKEKNDSKNSAGKRLKPVETLPSVKPLPEITRLPPVKTIPKPTKLPPVQKLPKPQKLPW